MGLRVIQVIASLSRRSSGVFAAVMGLAQAQQHQGLTVTVVGQRDPQSREDLEPFRHLDLRPVRVLGPQRLGFSPALSAELARLAGEADIIHSHGMWMFPNWAAGWTARRRGIPLVVAPHGTLDPWALTNPTLRKKLAWYFLDRRVVRRAACLQALSLGEAKALQRLPFQVPIAHIPNGVRLKDYENLPPPEAFGEIFPTAAHHKLLLFLSRFHPKKGIFDLIQAWARVAPHHPDWLLVLAGFGPSGYREEMKLAQEAGVASRILFTGALYGAQKLTALATAEGLVLPSYSEGFTLILLEALACRKPVLITPQCYFPEAVAAGAALEIARPGVDAVARALTDFLTLSPRDRQIMGEKGRTLVEEQYTWEAVAARTTKVYRWLSGAGPRPPCLLA